MSAPTYTELFEKLYGEPGMDEAEFLLSLDEPARKAWTIIDKLKGRGFDHWFGDIDEEIQDEIFEEIRSTIAES